MPIDFNPNATWIRAGSKTDAGPQGMGRPANLEKTCQEFESLFVNYMLQQMRRTVPEDSLFGGGRAEEMYTSMMDGELARSIAHQGGLGLAAVLFQQLKRQAEDGNSEDR